MEKPNTTRPPIVAILGHVDHGKTTLLDVIRKTNVAAREVGGITQKIGVYTVETLKGEKITFIDTPGHEAFQAMRARGAKAADIAILVVAANEGAKPQTRESLSLLLEDKIPFIVAITKTDLPSANVESVKVELASLGVALEDQGGDVPVVPVSAKTGEGIPHLLETITLICEIHGLKGGADEPLQGYIIESRQDPRRGPVATVVITAGKISIGDELRVEKITGKVKALRDEFLGGLDHILPGMAGEILGFTSTPPVGGNVIRGGLADQKPEAPTFSRSQIDTSKRINIILKTDSLGSLEAILAALPTDVAALASGIGDVNQNDVMLASSFGVPILGFNVKVLPQVEDTVQKEKIKIVLFGLIYEILEWLSKSQEKEEEKEDNVLGRAEVRAEFPYGKGDRIAGVMVLAGRIAKGDRLRLVRDGTVVGESRIRTLRQRKNSIDTIAKNTEGGILFRGKVDFKIGDVLESLK